MRLTSHSPKAYSSLNIAGPAQSCIDCGHNWSIPFCLNGGPFIIDLLNTTTWCCRNSKVHRTVLQSANAVLATAVPLSPTRTHSSIFAIVRRSYYA